MTASLAPARFVPGFDKATLTATRSAWVRLCALGCVQVLPNGTGIRRRPLFFIDWMWRKVSGPDVRWPSVGVSMSSFRLPLQRRV